MEGEGVTEEFEFEHPHPHKQHVPEPLPPTAEEVFARLVNDWHGRRMQLAGEFVAFGLIGLSIMAGALIFSGNMKEAAKYKAETKKQGIER